MGRVRRLAAVMAWMDPDLAAVVATAIRGYLKARADAGMSGVYLPAEEFRCALELLAARSRQPLARGARGPDADSGDRGHDGVALSLSYAQAAEISAIPVRSLQRYVANGDLPAYRVGRRVLILPADLYEFITKERA